MTYADNCWIINWSQSSQWYLDSRPLKHHPNFNEIGIVLGQNAFKRALILQIILVQLTSDRLLSVLRFGRTRTSLKSSLMSLSILGIISKDLHRQWTGNGVISLNDLLRCLLFTANTFYVSTCGELLGKSDICQVRMCWVFRVTRVPIRVATLSKMKLQWRSSGDEKCGVGGHKL